MKILSTLSSLFIITMLAAPAYAQQQFTQTVTAQNKNCNATCSVMDVAELNNNPAAIILITALDNAGKAHPVTAYYMYLKKWSVMNLDGVAITERRIKNQCCWPAASKITSPGTTFARQRRPLRS